MDSSPFTGAHVVKIIDSNLDEFGIQNNPIYTANSIYSRVDEIDFITVSNTTSGDTVLVPGVAGQRFFVFALSIFTEAGTSCTLNFTDGIGGNVLYSSLIVATNQSPLSFSQAVTPPAFIFFSSDGNDLVANFSSAIIGVINLSYFTY